MEKKKVAETINIRINVGQYQHIEISKYAEKEIEYDSHDEMVQKEDQVTAELVDNLIRNMRTIPDKLGKETNAVEKFEDRVTKTIPEFMKGSQEPNLAKKKSIQVDAEEKNNTDAKNDTKKAVEDLVEDKEVEKIDDDELFADIM